MNPFPIGQKAEGVAASHEEPQRESRIFPGNTGERHGQAARSYRKESQQRRGSAGIFPCRERAMDILTVSVMDKGMTVIIRMGMSR